MIDRTKYTLVLQGKLHEHTIRMCNFHKDIETIVSTWEPYASARTFLESALRPNLKIVTNPIPDVEEINNDANRYYQYISSLYGIEMVNTEFVIKARTDEYYSNLDFIIAASDSMPDKIVTNNVFFRKTRFYPYHPSDHLMLGKANYMASVFRECMHQCKSANVPPKAVPEQQMAMTFIAQRENKPISELPTNENEAEVNQLMIKYFDVVSTSELGKFNVKYNYLSKQWENIEYIDRERDVCNSHSLEEEL
jgi:hypothetical protein